MTPLPAPAAPLHLDAPPGPVGPLPGPAGPLVVSGDPTLLEAVARVAAAAGAVPGVAADVRDALLGWARAPLVVVGADAAEALAALAPPRRDDVVVVGWSPVPDVLFRDAVAVGAEQVLALPAAEPALADLFADRADPAAGRGLVVGVVGGSGGAGATTTACVLAEVAARGGHAVVVDLDPLGPGLDRVVGFEDADGLRWDGLRASGGRLSGRALATALPRVRGTGVLTWAAGDRRPVAPETVREVLLAAARGHDVVVVDLPRAVDAVVDEVVARCDRLLVVCRPTVAGAAAAARTCARWPQAAPVGLVLVGRGDPAAVERVVGRPVLGELPLRRGLDEQVDLGLGPVRSRRGPLVRAAHDVLDALGGTGAARSARAARSGR